MNRPLYPAVFTVPRLVGGLAGAVVLAASIASYSFTAPLARLAGADESLAWLWPVVAGLAVAQIAYTSVVLTRLSHYERVKPLLTVYRLLLLAAVVIGGMGSVMAATGMPSELSTAGTLAIVSFPPWCLVFCIGGYLVLSQAIPDRIEKSARDAGLRDWAERPAHAERLTAAQDTISQESPWWEQSEKAARNDFPAEGDPARPPSS